MRESDWSSDVCSSDLFPSHDTDNRDIVYIDRNNLYGEAQISMLPQKGFRWLTSKEVEKFDVSSNFDGEDGYILEVDLDYPEGLHIPHSNLPLAPEVLEIGFDNLSPYSQEAIRKSEGVKNYKDIKLLGLGALWPAQIWVWTWCYREMWMQGYLCVKLKHTKSLWIVHLVFISSGIIQQVTVILLVLVCLL